ncbi:hypothetical protein H6P81_002729 [Aristolochia fimbriata]|uniref:Uncharacterized protein n=1 Tax=Aristolochia fimbriata TaxID=158543 RepID=A0AAV7FEF8_ARIFI|nr:hypothetical protein H6P81_002729 [Aristolochia fimbriata]
MAIGQAPEGLIVVDGNENMKRNLGRKFSWKVRVKTQERFSLEAKQNRSLMGVLVRGKGWFRGLGDIPIDARLSSNCKLYQQMYPSFLQEEDQNTGGEWPEGVERNGGRLTEETGLFALKEAMIGEQKR